MNNTKHYYSPKQGRLPVFISDILNICDPVLAFDRIMEEIEIDKYESGMTLMMIVAEGAVSRRNAYRYLEYYKELQEKTDKKKSVQKGIRYL